MKDVGFAPRSTRTQNGVNTLLSKNTLSQNGYGCGGCGGCGTDVELDAHLCRYTSVGAPNWCGRTPGSLTPDVLATLSPRQPTDVGHQGLSPGTRRPDGRSPKMLHFCSKNAHHEPTGGQRELTSKSAVHRHVGNMYIYSRSRRRLTHELVSTVNQSIRRIWKMFR